MMYPYAVKMNGKYYKPNEEIPEAAVKVSDNPVEASDGIPEENKSNEEIPEAAVEASNKPVETSDGIPEENITGTPKRAKKTVKKASE